MQPKKTLDAANALADNTIKPSTEVNAAKSNHSVEEPLNEGAIQSFKADEQVLQNRASLPPLYKTLSRTRQLVALGLAQGLKHAIIADRLGISLSTVETSATDPVVRSVVTDMRLRISENVMEYINARAVKAFSVVEDLMENSDRDSVRLAAALATLERALGKVAQQHEHRVTTFADVLKAIKSAAIDVKHAVVEETSPIQQPQLNESESTND